MGREGGAQQTDSELASSWITTEERSLAGSSGEADAVDHACLPACLAVRFRFFRSISAPFRARGLPSVAPLHDDYLDFGQQTGRFSFPPDPPSGP